MFIFIWLHQVLAAALRVFTCGMQDLVPWPGMEPQGPPTLGVRSLSHWTTRDVPPPKLSPAHKLGKCWDTRGHTGHIKLRVTSAFCVPTAHTQ